MAETLDLYPLELPVDLYRHDIRLYTSATGKHVQCAITWISHRANEYTITDLRTELQGKVIPASGDYVNNGDHATVVYVKGEDGELFAYQMYTNGTMHKIEPDLLIENYGDIVTKIA